MLTYQNEDYMGSLNKKVSDPQCFIIALGLFWDIVTDLEHPMTLAFLNLRGIVSSYRVSIS